MVMLRETEEELLALEEVAVRPLARESGECSRLTRSARYVLHSFSNEIDFAAPIGARSRGGYVGLEWPVVVVFGLAIVAGSVVQGSAGFGVSLIGVPVLMLLDPTLMPGAMLVVGFMLPLFTIVREGRHTDWPKVRLTLSGRLLGTVGGVLVVTSLPSRYIAIGLGVFILVVVLLSTRSVELPMNPRTLFGTGLLSGVTGTASSVSGPIVGLAMQRMPGAPLRATIAVFFSAGTFLSLTGLAIGGALPMRQVAMGALMLPFLAVGYALSGPLRRFLDNGWTRPAVLAVSSVSAIVVLVKAVFFDR